MRAMCGRFAQSRSADELARLFRARPVTDAAVEQHNVAPTDEVLSVVDSYGERVIDVYRWGLLPFWSKDRREAARRINARAESLDSSPAFRAAFRSRRCLVPADGFFEWRRDGPRPAPWFIHRRDGAPLAFAGLWETWHEPGAAEHIYSCAIVTIAPNRLVAAFHHRMPISLPSDAWDAWLEPETPMESLVPLLVAPPAEELEAVPLGHAVNDVRAEGAELLAPIGAPVRVEALPDWAVPVAAPVGPSRRR